MTSMSSSRSSTFTKRTGVTCFLANTEWLANTELTLEETPKTNPIETLVRTSIIKLLNALKKPAICSLLLLGFLSLWHPNASLAFSGGCMGGDSSGSSSSSDGGSYDSSSSWSSRNYGLDSSSPSSAFGSHQGNEAEQGTEVEKSRSNSKSSVLPVALGVVGVLGVGAAVCTFGAADKEKASVITLQVALSGKAQARSLQGDLNRIAEKADTSSTKGLLYILKDVDLSQYEAKKLFKQLSATEREKFDELTLVNVNNIREKRASSQKADDKVSTEYIVITILLAANEKYELPTINGRGDLKEALEKLHSTPLATIMAVEVLWAPQLENDALSKEELLKNYSLLRPL